MNERIVIVNGKPLEMSEFTISQEDWEAAMKGSETVYVTGCKGGEPVIRTRWQRLVDRWYDYRQRVRAAIDALRGNIDY